MRQLILLSIVISQIGFAAAYIVFTSENLKAFIGTLFQYHPDQLLLTLAYSRCNTRNYC